jgi:hypothetical protein
LEVLKKISKEQLLTYQRRKPKMSDLELISLNLTAEFMGIDSENDLFRKLPTSISSKIERSVYNRRKRNLLEHMNVKTVARKYLIKSTITTRYYLFKYLIISILIRKFSV